MSTVENAFVRIRQKAEIKRTDNARYQPRLHDLRHSFAVHRLMSWYQENADVQQLLPILSVYMGHTYLAATFNLFNDDKRPPTGSWKEV